MYGHKTEYFYIHIQVESQNYALELRGIVGAQQEGYFAVDNIDIELTCPVEGSGE